MMLLSLTLALIVPFASGAVQHAPALIARQGLTGFNIETLCGPSPVDCGNGWCCVRGSTCITALTGEPACRDGILTDVGGGPMTLYAAPFSSLMSALTSAVASLPGINVSTLATTISGGTAALPTYSHTEILTTPIFPTATGLTPTSRGAAEGIRAPGKYRIEIYAVAVPAILGLI